MVTVKDVAREAEVSTATVSRVINNDKSVLTSTRDRVLDAIKKLKYNIHPAARTLKSGVSLIVGVIVPELSNVFFMSVCEHMEKELRAVGYSMLLCSSGNTVQGEIEQLDKLIQRLVDGIIVIPARRGYSHFEAAQKKVPIVFVDRGFTDLAGDYVLAENEQGAYNAVTALIHDGFKHIGFVGGDMDLLPCRERYAGYIRALNEAGIAIDENFISLTGMGFESGYEGFDSILQKNNHPRAFFFVNLLCSLGAARRITEEPYTIRQSLVCASFDYVFYSSLMTWCRYFVGQPTAEFASQAAALLLRRMEERSSDTTDSEHTTIRLATSLHTQCTAQENNLFLSIVSENFTPKTC